MSARLLPLLDAAAALPLPVEALLDKIAAGEVSAINRPVGEPLILVADEPCAAVAQVDPAYAAGVMSRVKE